MTSSLHIMNIKRYTSKLPEPILDTCAGRKKVFVILPGSNFKREREREREREGERVFGNYRKKKKIRGH